MWVSGSLISSRTWRSSSVSAPFITSFDLLAQLVGQIPHDPGQLGPGVADRLHAGLHHALLKLGDDVIEPLQRRRELALALRAQDLEQLVAGQDELGDHGHEVFQELDVDPDRLVGDRRLLRGVLGLRGRRGRGLGLGLGRRFDLRFDLGLGRAGRVLRRLGLRLVRCRLGRRAGVLLRRRVGLRRRFGFRRRCRRLGGGRRRRPVEDRIQAADQGGRRLLPAPPRSPLRYPGCSGCGPGIPGSG